jgi:hypothetical protein
MVDMLLLDDDWPAQAIEAKTVIVIISVKYISQISIKYGFTDIHVVISTVYILYQLTKTEQLQFKIMILLSLKCILHINYNKLYKNIIY